MNRAEPFHSHAPSFAGEKPAMPDDSKIHKIESLLPPVDTPAGSYVHAVRTGNLLFLAGKGVKTARGKVGSQVSKEEAYRRARDVGLLLLAAMKHELGDLGRVKRVVKVVGFVNAAPDFEDHPFVINGCSDLFVEAFGDAGKHARSAVGVASLPFGISVEIEAIVEVA
jgi:enamine deaminase RidA (YjgF/YER057c/UK114 family)